MTAEVEGDPAEPRPEPLGVGQPGQVDERDDDRFLDDVGREVVVAQETGAHADSQRSVAHGELTERLLVAALGISDELGVARTLGDALSHVP